MSQPLHQQPTRSGQYDPWRAAQHPGPPQHPGGAGYPGPHQGGPPYPGAPSPAGHHPYPPPQSYPPQPYPGASYPDQRAPFPARPQARYSAPPPSPQPPRPRRRRRALLVIVILFLLMVAGLVIAGTVIDRAPEPVRVADTGAVAQPGTLSVFELQPGDCYNTTMAPPPPGQTQPISSVEAVACTAPHTDQVIAKVSYSGAEALAGVPDAKADEDCNTQFQAKLDPAAFTDATLKPGRLAPADAATWARKPVIACVVFSDNPLTRSLLR